MYHPLKGIGDLPYLTQNLEKEFVQ